MGRKRWSELSPTTRRLIIVGATVEGALKSIALIDLARIEGASERHRRRVPRRHLGSDRVEAGGHHGRERGLPVRGHPQSPQVPHRCVTGHEGLAAPGGTRDGHPSARVEEAADAVEGALPSHARRQHQIRLLDTYQRRSVVSPMPGGGAHRHPCPQHASQGSVFGRRGGASPEHRGWFAVVRGNCHRGRMRFGGATSGSSVLSVPLCPWALGRAPDRALGRPCRCRPSGGSAVRAGQPRPFLKELLGHRSASFLSVTTSLPAGRPAWRCRAWPRRR